MYSGISLTDDIIELFNSMKIKKIGQARRKFLHLKIVKDEKLVVCDEFDALQQTSTDDFQHLLNYLCPKQCCFLIYDVTYTTKNSLTKNDLILIIWCPDDAKPRDRMKYSSTRSEITTKLIGLKLILEINSLDEINRSTLAEKLQEDVVKIEGQTV